MKINITKKLLFLFLIVVFFTVLVSLSVHFLFFRQYYLIHTENRLLNTYNEVESSLLNENFEQIVGEMNFRQQVGIIIADKDFDNLIFSHNLTDETKERLIYELTFFINSNISDLEQSHIYKELYDNILDTDDGNFELMVFVKELSNDNYCIISHQLETLESSMSAMNTFHFTVGIIACILGMFATIFFAKRFTKPIIAINNATEKMSQLDFNQKIGYSSQDELGQLANNINILSSTLEDYKIALKKEIEFQKILSQNMSHELKTPISVMKGYLEAINYGIASKKGKVDEYISVVLNECNQMTQLIDQMLNLSKLSNSLESNFKKSSFSADTFVENIKSQHNNLLNQQNIEFIADFNNVNLWGNIELLTQCIGNFITNAVKYGDGKIIVLKIEEKEEFLEYSVFNTGENIPKDELEQIFGVFYMVDKARSREKNSHGLGLSVCKSVAEFHKGTVFCQNENDGVTFYLKLQKNNF